MQQGLAISQAIGVEAGLTGIYSMIAESSLKAGQFRLAADAIADGFKFVKIKDEHAWEPELHRIKGELALEQFRKGTRRQGRQTRRERRRGILSGGAGDRARRDRASGSSAPPPA
jgi:hypothetical protein